MQPIKWNRPVAGTTRQWCRVGELVREKVDGRTLLARARRRLVFSFPGKFFSPQRPLSASGPAATSLCPARRESAIPTSTSPGRCQADELGSHFGKANSAPELAVVPQHAGIIPNSVNERLCQLPTARGEFDLGVEHTGVRFVISACTPAVRRRVDRVGIQAGGGTEALSERGAEEAAFDAECATFFW